ncbi:PAS-domain containing protein [uncultured Tateyamaria sp.]|uniref:PAS-domain containing protein n=1 Tax=Tateyamaria sp. 1078 TaxID=3417464 RepID=UPI00261BBE7F|nr:PAS-domain containing protein [uncultured Tateyamaria sp.]
MSQIQSPDILHRSRDTSVLLRSGLNMIQQALSIYSDDLRLIVANQRFRAMFGLPPHLCEPGAPFSDTIRYLVQTGEYGDVNDPEGFIQARVQQALTFEQHYVERKRSNGRWISVEGGPLRQGGWVTVYTDITDIKRQEEMLRSHSDELSGRLLDRSEELARANRALEATISRLHETQQHLEAAEARVRLAAETTPAHIARLDQQERYTYSNQRLPLHPYNGADDIVGHTAQSVLGPQIYSEITPALRSAYDGHPKVVEFTVAQDGRHIRAAFTPDTNSAGVVTGVYVLSMDITLSQSGDVRQSRTAQFGAWTAQFDRLDLSGNGDPVALTVAEAALLRAFLTAANRLITREEIFAAPGLSPCSDRALDVRISRLRQKLGDDPKAPKHIRTVYGAGYIFVGDVTWTE